MVIYNNTSDKSISDVYAGKSIFVTGATGFLGKVLIEKILYSCPKISSVYILIREKPNMSIDERLKKIFNIPLFDRLRKERPQDFNKIVPINGDICLPNLGMKKKEEDMLQKTISMVFHIAAMVKFNKPLQIAMAINMKGTKRVLEFCQRVKNLKAFVYVSTAFTNSNLEFVGERVYPSPIPLDEAEEIADRSYFSKEETAKILNGRWNTYTFTKEIAENLVAKYQGLIPSAIVRPSIVLSSKAEPVVGWVDNWYGATGIILPIAQGVNRVMLSDPRNTIDLIPVDYVANTIIIAATRCEGSQEVAVYNCSSSCENPIGMGEFIGLCTKHSVKLKFMLSSKAEPVVGWVDNWYGATGIILPIAQGVNRVMLSDPRNTIDLIPVDYVANTIIIAATRCEGSQEVAVYNCSSSCENPIGMGEFIGLCTKHSVKLKFNIMPFPMYVLTKSKWLVNVIVSIQKLPVIIADLVLYVIGKKPRYVKYQTKALASQMSSENFTNRTWSICAERTCALYASLSATDRECFPCDPRNIVWAEFIPTYVEGVKKYLCDPLTSKLTAKL